jgi:hypothetical protein
MAIDQSLLLKIKINLRITHSVLDDDLSDTIAACLEDLKVCGVRTPEPDNIQDFDPLILNAVKLYCRKEYTDDTGKAAEYQKRYDSLKSCLMMASEYKKEAPSDD